MNFSSAGVAVVESFKQNACNTVFPAREKCVMSSLSVDASRKRTALIFVYNTIRLHKYSIKISLKQKVLRED